ncbi:hypothetical protein [Streptomyces sp. NPDC059008]|uniref:hypothetical protein n=1 Tax=Streptomyces sp. NPDC059008 TaxID=3346693 RepID=UPI00367787ED
MTDATAPAPQHAPYGAVPETFAGHHAATANGFRAPNVPLPTRRTRDPQWWCPAAIALSVIGLLWFPGFFLYCFATMATDSCGPDHCPAGITVPLVSAPWLYLTGAGLALLSGAFPWTLRWRTARLALASGGAAAAVSALPLLLAVFI